MQQLLIILFALMKLSRSDNPSCSFSQMCGDGFCCKFTGGCFCSHYECAVFCSPGDLIPGLMRNRDMGGKKMTEFSEKNSTSTNLSSQSEEKKEERQFPIADEAPAAHEIEKRNFFPQLNSSTLPFAVKNPVYQNALQRLKESISQTKTKRRFISKFHSKVLPNKALPKAKSKLSYVPKAIKLYRARYSNKLSQIRKSNFHSLFRKKPITSRRKRILI